MKTTKFTLEKNSPVLESPIAEIEKEIIKNRIEVKKNIELLRCQINAIKPNPIKTSQ